MRKVLTALAGGALAMILSAPAAHAAPARPAQQQVRFQSDHQGDDDWNGGHHRPYHHEDRCEGLLTRLLCWLV